VRTAAEIARAIRLPIAKDNARATSHAAATERCVFPTAATPNLPPEKEIPNDHGNETGYCGRKTYSDFGDQERQTAHAAICGQARETSVMSRK
jgi:hypothetical protein